MFLWNDSYSVGIEEIDNQHKELLSLIAKLFNGTRFKKNIDEISDITDELTNFAIVHFQLEYNYMTKYSYPDIKAHTDEHNEITRKLNEFKFGLKNYNVDDFASELMVLLKKWFVSHLTLTDKKLYEYLKTLKVDFSKL
ncbi:MAG: hypothetical protein A2046_01340 [Bacteroidetes bacterium GWA2_30_7]|nr:MAG: hypothetical protein A2046_01340 [Bacteroidetes bacterium GWA2_30_7]